ncbi:hypothetical protein [Halobacillus massiliensis]|uniref:hypothetical protein n=1 Tax=Halobacillus massiliensis TaxID=1926286 RepID=UPI0015C4B73D|nr:hypothetical protein [Halobacillus massiliensis]
MTAVLKIIGIPIYIYLISLLISPLFDMDKSAQISIGIVVTLFSYWEVFFSRVRNKE